jgi:hypothetical protein
MHTWFWWKTLKERAYLEDLGVDERTILNKWNGRALTRFIWTSGELL